MPVKKMFKSRTTMLSRVLLLPLLFLASQATADFVFEPATTVARSDGKQLLDIVTLGQRMLADGESGLVIYSDDGADTWLQAAVPVSTTLTAVFFIGDKTGWAVGHSGVIVHTTDGGANWQLQFDGNQANRQYLEFTRQHEIQLRQQLSSKEVQQLDDAQREDLEYALEDAVYAIEDAEAAIDKGPADPFLDVLFIDADNGFAVGAYGMLYQTRDGGANWQFSGANIDNADRYHYYSLARDKAGTLFLSGEAGLLFLSSDLGVSWQRIEGVYDGSLFGVVATSESVIAFGLRGNIFRSGDLGQNWSRVETTNTYGLYGGAVLADDTVVLVGAGGTVLSSRDGGATFAGAIQPSRSTLSAVGSINEKNFAVGMSGVEKVKQSEAAQ
jgi:photosystem II stability/assembly factor-like uncharacterized protein